MKKAFLSLILIIVVNFVTMQVFSAQVTLNNKKLLVATVTAESCETCKRLKPVLEELKQKYDDQVEFITLDVSSKSSLEDSRQIAEEYNITDFFNKSKNAVPQVGILCPDGKIEKSFVGETNEATYEKALNELLIDTNKICTL
ncbi:MAG: thioredoxin family protein [Candidatus Melainabacteria bacterium]|nr:thioredoxin family protein [Candidatus Melainabacteria bacterium]